MDARALLDINSKWFVYITRLSQGGWGYVSRSNDFYLPWLRLDGGRVSTLWPHTNKHFETSL
jgi:hypothetical protein